MSSKKSDLLDGVKCFTIGGRMVDELQRRKGMTDEERRWRAQWLKDQVLSPDEPRDVNAYYKDTTNIFRRIYKTPMFWFHKALRSRLKPETALMVRHCVGKFFIVLLSTYVTCYYLKYHTNDFVVGRTVEIYSRRQPMFPDELNYPNYYKKKPHEYYDQGFYSSVLAKKL